MGDITVLLVVISFITFLIMYFFGSRAKGAKAVRSTLGGISNLGAAEILTCSMFLIGSASIASRYLNLGNDPILIMITWYSIVAIIGAWSQKGLTMIGIEIAELSFAAASQFIGLYLITRFPLILSGVTWVMGVLGL